MLTLFDLVYELDGIGPVDKRASTTSSTIFSLQKNKKNKKINIEKIFIYIFLI